MEKRGPSYTGNYSQYPVINHSGKEYEKEYTYIYISPHSPERLSRLQISYSKYNVVSSTELNHDMGIKHLSMQ